MAMPTAKVNRTESRFVLPLRLLPLFVLGDVPLFVPGPFDRTEHVGQCRDLLDHIIHRADLHRLERVFFGLKPYLNR